MNKHKLSRKKLTESEANQKIQNLFQKLSTHNDNLIYWMRRINIPFQNLDRIDRFILDTDNLKSAKEFIDMTKKEMDFIHFKIYEDYGRFVPKIINRVH